MDIPTLAGEFDSLTINETKEVLLEITDAHEHGDKVVSALLGEFDISMSDIDWDFLMEEERLKIY